MIITEEHAAAFSKNLTDIMARREITQAQMSSELKIPKTTVSSWMNGRRMPRAAAMSAICHYLNCTREDLLRLPGEPKKEFKPLPQDAPQAAQEPLRELAGDQDDQVLAALSAAGYGHLTGLFEVARMADQKDIDFVTATLKNIIKRKKG